MTASSAAFVAPGTGISRLLDGRGHGFFAFVLYSTAGSAGSASSHYVRGRLFFLVSEPDILPYGARYCAGGGYKYTVVHIPVNAVAILCMPAASNGVGNVRTPTEFCGRRH